MAAPLALLVTAPAVAFGVLASTPATSDPVAAPVTRAVVSLAELKAQRDTVSRAGSRYEKSSSDPGAKDLLRQQAAVAKKQAQRATQQAQKATLQAVQAADTRLWTTAPLNLWSAPQDDATRFGVTKSGVKVLVTGRRSLGRVELAVDGKSRWVTAGYLSEEKPEEGAPGIGGACTNGTSVSSGVSPNVVAVHQAVCAAYPSIAAYGTLRGGGGDHPLGKAVDIMISGSAGWDVANFVRANYAALGVTYVIYSQNIWSLERGGEGWRPMSDRGSVTANHYDHVHVSTY
ncbi:MAG: hypothetical protein ABIQ15_13855 [Nocardioides sp.]